MGGERLTTPREHVVELLTDTLRVTQSLSLSVEESTAMYVAESKPISGDGRMVLSVTGWIVMMMPTSVVWL